MNLHKNNMVFSSHIIDADFVSRVGDETWTLMKTVIDVAREPFLILDKKFCVMAANESFYQTFRVFPKDTEKKNIYELGNGQWNIVALRNLLEDILLENTFFKGFEVEHEFPNIGRKIMILNARKIFCKDDIESGNNPQIILLAIEDVTEIMMLATKIAQHTNNLEDELKKQSDYCEY